MSTITFTPVSPEEEEEEQLGITPRQPGGASFTPVNPDTGEPLPSQPSFPSRPGTQFTRGMVEQITENVANAPATLLEHALSMGVLGTDVDLPRVSGEGILSSIEGAISPSKTIEDVKEEKRLGEQTNPLATQAGRFGGDVMTLFGGRLPLRQGKAGGMFDEAIEKAVAGWQSRAARRAGATNSHKQLEAFVKSPALEKLLIGAGRSAEAGLEGLFMDMLQGGSDPLTTGAWAMGAQAAASGGLQLAKGSFELPFIFETSKKAGPISKAIIGLTAQGAIMGSIIELGMHIIPGGSNSPLAAEKGAMEKIATGLLAGMFFTYGKRTKPEGSLRFFPELGDAITAVPRSAVIDLAQKINANPELQQEYFNAIANISAYPPSFQKGLETAFNEGRVDEFLEEQKKNPRIAAALEAEDPRLARIKLRAPEKPLLPFGPS